MIQPFGGSMKGSRILVYFIFVIYLVGAFGCASSGSKDPRVKPSIADKAFGPVSGPDYPIKDKHLSLMYERVRKFHSVPWEQRERELFNIITQRITKATVDQYSHLLDIDQSRAVSQFLGPISNAGARQHCPWLKPKDKKLQYVRGGNCDSGVLEGVVELIERSDDYVYTWWVKMEGGRATKGVKGQTAQAISLSVQGAAKNPFQNWPSTFAAHQRKPLGVGHLDKELNWLGLAAQQGHGSSYRYIGEYRDGELNGWGARIQKQHSGAKNAPPYIQGLFIKYLGQWKDGSWHGIGVRVAKTEFYITPDRHWVPKNIEFSLGWKLEGDNYHSNGPTIEYFGVYSAGYGNNQPAKLYYGYNNNNLRQGAGGLERLFGSSPTSTMIGMYEDNKQAGYHRWYRNGQKMGTKDWCYNTRKYPCQEGSSGMGKFLALAGGALLAGQSSMNSTQQLEFMTAYTTDVLTDSGGSNTQAWADNGFTNNQDINDPLNPNNPINRRMQQQSDQALRKHHQEQEQKKQAYEAALSQRQQEIAAQKKASIERRKLQFTQQKNTGAAKPKDKCLNRKQVDADCGDKVTTYNIPWSGRAYTDGRTTAPGNTQADGSRYSGLSFNATNTNTSEQGKADSSTTQNNEVRDDSQASTGTANDSIDGGGTNSSGSTATKKKMGDVLPEALAICKPSKNNPENWWCDGPVQRLILADEPLVRQLEAVGCSKAQPQSRSLAAGDGRYVYFCAYGRTKGVDRNIAKIYSLPGHILVKRRAYQCPKYFIAKCDQLAQP